jgi:hypothetical protein
MQRALGSTPRRNSRHCQLLIERGTPTWRVRTAWRSRVAGDALIHPETETLLRVLTLVGDRLSAGRGRAVAGNFAAPTRDLVLGYSK